MSYTKIRTFISVLDRFKNRVRQLVDVNEKEAREINRYLDEDEKRVYEGPDAPDGVFSVTTILDEKDSDNYGLNQWKKNNNGVGDNANWEHILDYKTNRGTLAHYAAMNRFDHAFNHGDSMWTEDERSSQHAIDDRMNDDDYKYSILKDKGFVNDREGYEIVKNNEGGVDLQQVLSDDLDYVQEEFDKICRQQGIKASTVEEVEAMFALPENEESGHKGFGGQADLIYTDPNTGEHVVADIKTSKRIYTKHRHQIAAYARAAKEDPNLNGDYIDRCEIIRINPDNRESEVYELEDHEEYWEDFAELTRKAHES